MLLPGYLWSLCGWSERTYISRKCPCNSTGGDPLTGDTSCIQFVREIPNTRVLDLTVVEKGEVCLQECSHGLTPRRLVEDLHTGGECILHSFHVCNRGGHDHNPRCCRQDADGHCHITIVT